MGIKFEQMEQEAIILKRCKRDNEKEYYLGNKFYTNNENTIGEMEYETNGALVDNYVENSIPFSKKIENQVEPVVAMRRTIKIPNNDKVELNFIMTISEDKEEVLDNLRYYSNEENVKRELINILRSRIRQKATK